MGLRTAGNAPTDISSLQERQVVSMNKRRQFKIAPRLIAGLLVCGLSAGVNSVWAADFEREPISYSATVPQNAVADLKTELELGRVHFDFDSHTGYLPSLLKALKVPESSQMLVFSKTSFQRQRIAPKTPRAVYFNDDVYVGYCADGDVMEISVVDSKLGAVFYTLDQQPLERPRIARQAESCLLCHANSQTQGVPGFVMRSVYVDASGFPVLGSSAYNTDQCSPLAHRWGGWYVTGSHGKQKHLGNLVVAESTIAEETDNSAGMNVTSLAGRLKASKYLAPSSDIVALMVLAHQVKAHNLITAANFETRIALAQKPADRHKTAAQIQAVGALLVRYLFFSHEASLTAPIRGTTSFAADFTSRGPRDKRGRSLRDFDLKTRLFKYPCSYLVYSPAFDALPREIKGYVSKRMEEILTGADKSPDFSHLSATDRQAILEILKETKPALAGSWKPVTPVAAN
jgi:hypothetical protein